MADKIKANVGEPGAKNSDQVDFFLMSLCGLLRHHDAEVFYTTDDDGIHFKLHGEEVVLCLDEKPWEEIEKILKLRWSEQHA